MVIDQEIWQKPGMSVAVPDVHGWLVVTGTMEFMEF